MSYEYDDWDITKIFGDDILPTIPWCWWIMPDESPETATGSIRSAVSIYGCRKRAE